MTGGVILLVLECSILGILQALQAMSVSLLPETIEVEGKESVFGKMTRQHYRFMLITISPPGIHLKGQVLHGDHGFEIDFAR